MNGANNTPSINWKSKLRHEMVEYAVNVVYLTLVFAAFTQYRRLLLAAHDISYSNYWVSLIEALILGKVIMVGGIINLGRSMEQKPLIFSTLYKTLVFTVFVALFTLLEHMAKGAWQGIGALGGLQNLFAKDPNEMLARSLMIFVSLFPFFGVKELGRVLGQETIARLFFRSRP